MRARPDSPSPNDHQDKKSSPQNPTLSRLIRQLIAALMLLSPVGSNAFAQTPSYNTQLLVNGNAETTLGSEWVQANSSWLNWVSNTPTAYEGSTVFRAGQIASDDMYQDVDVSAYATEIDAGQQSFKFDSQIAGVDNLDTIQVKIDFLDVNGAVLQAFYDSGPQTSLLTWSLFTDTKQAPTSTRKIRVHLFAVKNYGSNADGQIDAMQLVALTPSASNNPPTLVSAVPDRTNDPVGVLVDYDLKQHFSDVEDANLTYTLTPNNTWLTLGGTNTDRIGGTPQASDVGTLTYTVRATDSGGLWKEDTFDVTVTAAPPPSYNTQLLVNGNAETTLGSEWVQANSSWLNWVSNTPTAYEGSTVFRAGQIASDDMYQDVDVSAYATEIDAGQQSFKFDSQIAGVDNLDTIQVKIDFLDVNGAVLQAFYDSGPQTSLLTWSLFTDTKQAPTSTRKIRVHLFAVKNYGSNADGQIDAMQLVALTPSASNNPPTLVSAVPDRTNDPVGVLVDYDLKQHFSDVEDANLTYTLTPNNTWLTLGGTNTDRIGGTPQASDVGTLTYTVRATDSGGLWKEDTFDVTVTAAPPPSYNTQLLVNGNAETTLGSEWVQANSSWLNWVSNTPTAYEGSTVFRAGQIASDDMYQDVDVSAYATEIDAGQQSFKFDSQIAGVDNLDTIQVKIDFLDVNGAVLQAFYDSGPQTSLLTWSLFTDTKQAPTSTRKIRVHLFAVKNYGSNADGQIDAMQLVALTPSASNNPPTLVSAVPDRTNDPVGVLVDYDLKQHFSDVEDANLTYTLTPNNTWLTLGGTNTDRIGGTPQASDVGTLTYTVRATDSGGLWKEDTFDVTVIAPTTGSNMAAYEYDHLGRLTKVIYPDSEVIEYQYDAAGNRTVKIVNGPSHATLSIDDVSSVEGGTLVFTVTRSGDLSNTDTVDFSTTDDSAVSPADYTSTSNTLTFAPNVVTQPIQVTTADDGIFQGPLTLFVDLSNASAGLRVVDGQGVGTITDNETGPTFSVADAVTVVEGVDSVFTVSLSGAHTSDLTVDYATSNGTATNATGAKGTPGSTIGDYFGVSGTLTFLTGETTKQVSVVTKDERAFDGGDEDFFLDLSNPSAGSAILDGQGKAIITDNDNQPMLSIADASGVEGSDLVFVVTRNGATSGSLDFTISSSDGTATAGSDYTSLVSSTYGWDGGISRGNVSLTSLTDSLSESDETVLLTITSAQVAGQDIPILKPQATGTITDTNAKSAASISSASVTEGGDITFTVTLSGPSEADHQFRVVSSDVSASAVADYEDIISTVRFWPGETSKTITLSTVDDALSEGDETFQLTLSNPTGGATIATATATGTVIDNDSGNSPPTAVDDSITVVEGNFKNKNVKSNDTDPDDDSLTVVSVTQPGNGTVVMISGNRVRFTGTTVGSSSFTYTISDGNGGTDVGTVTTIVTPDTGGGGGGP